MLTDYSNIAHRGVIDTALTRDILGLVRLLKYRFNEGNNENLKVI